jgi:hypothetical protein
MTRKKVSGTPLQIVSFWEGNSGMAFWHIQ